jgi:cystathionine beta-lyase
MNDSPSSDLYVSCDFDTAVERRGSDSNKWHKYGEDILPLWVADMDFPAPEPIVRALQERVAHGVFGYGSQPHALREAICSRMWQQHRWQVEPEHIVFLPGLVCGLNVVCRAIGERGDGILLNTPIYPPFLDAPNYQERAVHSAELAVTHKMVRGKLALYYEVDYEAMEAAVQPNTRLFMLCNPHNPVGRLYSTAEQSQMAEICLRHELVICSDEIHCDLLLGGASHTPIASLDEAIAQRTITLMAPSKTFNLPGLGCSMAIIPNAGLRERLIRASAGIVPHVNILGFVAALAAYTECDDWLRALRVYLTQNRDFVFNYLTTRMPELPLTYPEATYLAWIDCRSAGIAGNPQQFFLEQAGVALSDGCPFGMGGDGFVRLNFGCPCTTVEAALERMSTALQSIRQTA